MSDKGYSQIGPIFEVMSVCSHTIEWLDRQERERSDWEMYVNLASLGRALQEFIDGSRAGKLPVSIESPYLQFSVTCLGAVTSMANLIIRRVQDILPHICERFRQQTEFLLSQVNEVVEKLEDIAEAWEIGLDENVSARLSSAINYINREESEAAVPNWRGALELV
jgi:hypothetical protein